MVLVMAAGVPLVQGSTGMRLRGGDLAPTVNSGDSRVQGPAHTVLKGKEMASTTAPKVGPYELDVYGTSKGRVAAEHRLELAIQSNNMDAVEAAVDALQKIDQAAKESSKGSWGAHWLKRNEIEHKMQQALKKHDSRLFEAAVTELHELDRLDQTRV